MGATGGVAGGAAADEAGAGLSVPLPILCRDRGLPLRRLKSDRSGGVYWREAGLGELPPAPPLLIPSFALPRWRLRRPPLIDLTRETVRATSRTCASAESGEPAAPPPCSEPSHDVAGEARLRMNGEATLAMEVKERLSVRQRQRENQVKSRRGSIARAAYARGALSCADSPPPFRSKPQRAEMPLSACAAV